MEEASTPEKMEAAVIISAVKRYFNGSDAGEGSAESSIINALMAYFKESGDQV